MSNIDKIIEVAKAIIKDVDVILHRGQYTLILNNKIDILPLLKKLKENVNTKFDMLTDISAIDWLKDKDRFEVVYFLYSNEYKERLRIKVPIDEKDCTCPTATAIYGSANWYERETYDMYGIHFTDHPDMRRFYMPEDFCNPATSEPYYPLRKDFPLMGFPNEMPLPPFPEKTGKDVNW